MKRLLLYLCLSPIILFAQDRQDDAPPQIKQLVSITNMTGWTKNDLGKWSSAINSLPKYDHQYYFPVCEQILKIDLAEVNYKGNKMYCVVKFEKSRYVRFNKIREEYPVYYWLFDLSSKDTISGEVESVRSTTFNTIRSGFFSGSTIATWRAVSNDIIVHFENGLGGLDESFCIQSREDKKNGKFQFLMGAYTAEIQSFNFNNCTPPGDNNEMKNGYYEVPASEFLSFVNKIKPLAE
jgi:hypothetical protein